MMPVALPVKSTSSDFRLSLESRAFRSGLEINSKAIAAAREARKYPAALLRFTNGPAAVGELVGVVFGDDESFDGGGGAGVGVNLDDTSVKLNVLLGHLVVDDLT